MSAMTSDLERLAQQLDLGKALALLDLSRKIIAGEIVDPQEVARALVGLALDLAPVGLLSLHLTEEARKRADLVADLAEAAKFGG